MPEEFFPFLSDSCLPELSEEFSRTSHEGQFDIAVLTGQKLLVFYRMIYPHNFPQIGEFKSTRLPIHEGIERLCPGMHALELAKTAWNAVVTSEKEAEPSVVRAFEDIARSSVLVASQVMENFGIEGDEGGPLEEIRVLRGLLGDNIVSS